MTSKMKMNPKMILENTNCYGPKIEDTIKKYTLKKNYLKNEDKLNYEDKPKNVDDLKN